MIARSHCFRCDLIRTTVRGGIFRGAWRPFGRIPLNALLVYQRDVLVDHVVLHIRRPAIVGLSQLRDGATATGSLILPLVAGGT